MYEVMFVEEFQLSGIQCRAAVRERIQLELQARQMKPLALERRNRQTLLMISERLMTVVLSGALTVLEGWSPCSDGSVCVPHPASASQFSTASGSHPRR